MFKIAKYPNPILRKTALSVAKGDFNTSLKKMADDMAKVMYQDDGIGLAAPQVSKSIRLIVIISGAGKYKSYVNPTITFFSNRTFTTNKNTSRAYKLEEEKLVLTFDDEGRTLSFSYQFSDANKKLYLIDSNEIAAEYTK